MTPLTKTKLEADKGREARQRESAEWLAEETAWMNEAKNEREKKACRWQNEKKDTKRKRRNG